ncbi:class I SAM-dependent methyltransferase [Terrabacter carboxydivorans]|uniref:class I SAM-dependent methyltransferase n=1 Tax=Terrabacter carboxydivorans TaxID=619730 RepID=UPI0031D62BEC
MTHTHHDGADHRTHGPGGAPERRHHHVHDEPGLPGGDDLLDLDGEVLAARWAEALDRVAALAAEPVGSRATSHARVVDLGAGTGTGAIGLAVRLPDAEVVAVDVAEQSLARVAAKAQAAGVADRVRTLVADLDDGWPDLAPVDLTWASMSLHHLADPVRSLAELRAITSPRGLVAVSEFDEPVRFLPDDLGIGRPGFEDRAVAALGSVHAEAVPHIGAPWATLLTEAGWTVVDQHEVVIDERSPGHPLAGRYARAWFDRLAHGLEGRLDADDEQTLAALLDDDGPHALLRRDDLHLHGIRTLTVARA